MAEQGVRKYLNPKKSCLPNSLLRDFLLTNGMSVKNETTEDVIQLSFDYGTVSEEEDLKRFGELKCDSCFYEKISKDDLRTEYYQNGVSINNIHYKRLYRSTGSAKKGSVIFIREELWDKANDYITMGMKFIEGQKEKVVELQAYSSLVASGIESKVHIPANSILIVEDEEKFFTSKVNVLKKENAEVVLTEEERKIKSTLWDGMALADVSLFDNNSGMILLRQAFFKSCAFKTDIQGFISDYCMKHNKNYDTFTIKDCFGKKHLAKNIKLITTTNSVKWIKFKDKMGDDPLSYWLNWIKKDKCMFGVVKSEHPSKYGTVNRMSYQMINSSMLSYEDVRELAKQDLERITQLKINDDCFLSYLKENQNEMNCYEMVRDLIGWNKDIIHSDFVQELRNSIVKAEVKELKRGRLRVEGDNMTLCSNPVELLEFAITGKYSPVFQNESDCIQVYSKRFTDKEFLCAFRSPQNSQSNVGYFHNTYIPLIDKYFCFTNNILVVNSINTDIEDLLNGADFDSDFVFLTNNDILVRSAKECYNKFLTVVNDIPLAGNTSYVYSMKDIARLDIHCQSTQRNIGVSSNISQIALSHWHNNPNDELQKIIVEMAVICQCIIDSSKRVFDVDTDEEIKKCKKQLPQGIPTFFKEVAGKEKNLISLNCPKDFLQTIVQKDLPKVRKKEVKELVSFKVKLPSYRKCNYKQVDRLIALCERHVKRVDYLRLNYDREDYHRLLVLEDEKFRTDIQKVRIKDNETINVAVKRILSDESYKRLRRVVLKSLFELNRERFLAQFERN